MRSIAPAVAFCLGLLLQGQSPVKPKPAENKKSPAQIEKERVEREVQGVWQILEYNNPSMSGVVKTEGFMVLFDGWMSLSLVVTIRDFTLGTVRNAFVATTRRYEVTNQNRLRLTNVWGYYNESLTLKSEITGSTEERQIVIIGPPDPGQRLRMMRTPDDSITFIRKSAAPKLPEAASAEKTDK